MNLVPRISNMKKISNARMCFCKKDSVNKIFFNGLKFVKSKI